jgi:hypothetical protein
MFSMSQPFAALLLNGVKTIETRGTNEFAALTTPGEVLLLHVGFNDWPADREQPDSALCGGGALDPLSAQAYTEACSLTRKRHGFSEDDARSKIVGLVKVGRSWRNPFAKRGNAKKGAKNAVSGGDVPQLTLPELQRQACLLNPADWLTEVLAVVHFKHPVSVGTPLKELPAACPASGVSGSKPCFLKVFDKLPRKVLIELKAANPKDLGSVVDGVVLSLQEQGKRQEQQTQQKQKNTQQQSQQSDKQAEQKKAVDAKAEQAQQQQQQQQQQQPERIAALWAAAAEEQQRAVARAAAEAEAEAVAAAEAEAAFELGKKLNEEEAEEWKAKERWEQQQQQQQQQQQKQQQQQQQQQSPVLDPGATLPPSEKSKWSSSSPPHSKAAEEPKAEKDKGEGKKKRSNRKKNKKAASAASGDKSVSNASDPSKVSQDQSSSETPGKKVA